MALAEAILVCLTDEPLTGYDLAKTFSTSIGFFWHADHQQIYRVLRTLKEAGLVSDTLVVQEGRPNKKVYAITPAGRERLVAWSQQATTPPSVKDDMMVKLYALEHVDTDAVRAEVATRLEHHRRRLALYERIRDTSFATVDETDPKQVGRLLGLRLGLAYERAWIDWCTEALARLDGLG
jgi:DNA-binding PadR family transcriptional regulator